jgi:hypothetical protein
MLDRAYFGVLVAFQNGSFQARFGSGRKMPDSRFEAIDFIEFVAAFAVAKYARAGYNYA